MAASETRIERILKKAQARHSTRMDSRTCAGCKEELTNRDFSKSQLKRGGEGQCKHCVAAKILEVKQAATERRKLRRHVMEPSARYQKTKKKREKPKENIELWPKEKKENYMMENSYGTRYTLHNGKRVHGFLWHTKNGNSIVYLDNTWGSRGTHLFRQQIIPLGGFEYHWWDGTLEEGSPKPDLAVVVKCSNHEDNGFLYGSTDTTHYYKEGELVAVYESQGSMGGEVDGVKDYAKFLKGNKQKVDSVTGTISRAEGKSWSKFNDIFCNRV